MIQRLVLILMAIFTLTACNRDNVTVRPDGEGSAIATISLTEAEFNTMIATVLANNANPLLRNPSVDFQSGQVVISGEHDKRDGSGRVSGTIALQVQVVDGAIDRQQIERPQGADLVHASGEAPAAEHQCRLGARTARTPGTSLALGLQLDDLPHRLEHSREARD